jgi:aryl-alcohol dehydrogenase-like predicted oxidoreductase
MRALDDMVRTGKILYAGISDAPAWLISQANTLADLRGWTPFTGLQVEYSLLERTAERDLLPMANALDIGVTAWSPLAGGLLTGKYYNKKNETQVHQKQEENALEQGRLIVVSSRSGDPVNIKFKDKDMLIIEEVNKIANEIGCTPAQIALNWIRQQQKGRNNIIPIVGARNAYQIKQNLECLNFQLTEAQLKRIDDISKIELGFPHDFLGSEIIRDIIYGGTFASIRNHRS